VATAPWTLPSHASMFTGKYAFEHGARSFLPEVMTPRNAYPLSLEQTTLAEVLKGAGFRTGAFVANEAFCGPWTQLDQGFDTYFAKYMYANDMLPHVFAWLNKCDATPFLLFINLMDTHGPYNVAPRPGFIKPPADPDVAGAARRFAAAVMRPGGHVPADLRRKVIDQCDTAIANVDEQVGKLLEKLQALKLFDDTLIVIASDHGEYFGEHLLVGHSKDVYQAALAVPLIVKNAGQTTGRVVPERVSLVILPNLICAQLPEPARGRALPQFPKGGERGPILAENYYTRAKDLFGKPWSPRFRRVRTAYFDGPYKYIASSDGANELYNLQQDSPEDHDLIGAATDVAQDMAAKLAQFQAGRPAAPSAAKAETPLTREQLRTLQSLGYVDAPNTKEEEPESQPAEPPNPHN
jgi:arylsulfatase A-like enzyme